MSFQRSTTRSPRAVGVLLAVALSALVAGLFAPSVMAEGSGGEVPALGSVNGGGAIPAAGEAAPTTAVASPGPAPEAATPALGSQAGEAPLDTPSGPLALSAVTDAYDFVFEIAASKADTYSDAPDKPNAHSEGGGSYGAGAGEPGQGWTGELLARDFSCGDVVSFLVTVTTQGPVPEGQASTVEADLRFGAGSDTKPGAGFNDILGATVLHTDAAAEEGALQSEASWSNETFVGEPFTNGAQLDATLTVTNVERGDFVVVRLDVRLACDPSGERNGYLFGSIQASRETAPNQQDTGASPIYVHMVHLASLSSPFIFDVEADPTTVVRDRDVVTYTVKYNSVDPTAPATIRKLTDSVLGDVTQVQGDVISTTCTLNLIAPPMGSAPGTCAYTAKSMGAPGTSEVHDVEASDEVGGFAHDSVTIQIVAADAAVSITKTFDEITADPDGSGTVTPGDRIRFVITVTNTGDVPLTGVEVVDLLPGATKPQCSNLGSGSLPVDSQAVCTVDYTIAAADAAAGGVENTAEVTTNETDAATGSVSVSVSQGAIAPQQNSTSSVPVSVVPGDPPSPSPTRGATVIGSQLPFTGAGTVRVVSFAVAILAAGAASIVWGAGARRPVRPLGS